MQGTEDLYRFREWIEVLGHRRPLLTKVHDKRVDHSDLKPRAVPLIISRNRIQCTRKLSPHRLDQSIYQLIRTECLNGSPRWLPGLGKCRGQRARQKLVIETLRQEIWCHNIEAFARLRCRGG